MGRPRSSHRPSRWTIETWSRLFGKGNLNKKKNGGDSSFIRPRRWKMGRVLRSSGFGNRICRDSSFFRIGAVRSKNPLPSSKKSFSHFRRSHAFHLPFNLRLGLRSRISKMARGFSIFGAENRRKTCRVQNPNIRQVHLLRIILLRTLESNLSGDPL